MRNAFSTAGLEGRARRQRNDVLQTIRRSALDCSGSGASEVHRTTMGEGREEWEQCLGSVCTIQAKGGKLGS